MSKKRFEIRLTLAEQGNEPELLATINAEIEMLHAYFDGRWYLPHGIKPYLSMWRHGQC